MKVYRQITANDVAMTPYPFRQELAMEAYLLENQDILALDHQDFAEVDVLDAEIALAAGRRDRNGRIDILAKYGGQYLGIVELKLNELNEGSLSQLQDYLDQKQQLLDKFDYWEEEEAPKWVGVLVGTSIDPLLQQKIENGYEYEGTPIAAMTVRRFRSDRGEIFVIADTFFRANYSSKDYSKFRFNGVEYNKGRLVQAVVAAYVEAHPNVTFAQLKEAFPDNIQGSKQFGVFTQLQDAEALYDRWGHKRHYIKPEEAIPIGGEQVIATCTQWNPKNIARFVNRANALGLGVVAG